MLRSYLLFFIRLTRYYLFCISTSFGFVNRYLSKVNWLCFYMFHNSFFALFSFSSRHPMKQSDCLLHCYFSFPGCTALLRFLCFFAFFFVFRLIIERKRERARKADSRKRNIWFEKTNDKYRRRIVLGFVFLYFYVVMFFFFCSFFICFLHLPFSWLPLVF